MLVDRESLPLLVLDLFTMSSRLEALHALLAKQRHDMSIDAPAID